MTSQIITYFFVLICTFMPLLADPIRIETFQGKEISPYVQEIVSLCNKIYREYPYLYNGNDEEYTSYLESYSQDYDSIICLTFDGEKAIGLAIGTPMIKSRDIYKPTLIEHGYDLNSMFYFGEFGLKPEYHGQEIEEKMYRKIEDFVKLNDRFTMISYWEINPSSNIQSANGYIPGEAFWKKLGFVRYPDLNFSILWTNINESFESPHLAVYSLKKL